MDENLKLNSQERFVLSQFFNFGYKGESGEHGWVTLKQANIDPAYIFDVAQLVELGYMDASLNLYGAPTGEYRVNAKGILYLRDFSPLKHERRQHVAGLKLAALALETHRETSDLEPESIDYIALQAIYSALGDVNAYLDIVDEVEGTLDEDETEDGNE